MRTRLPFNARFREIPELSLHHLVRFESKCESVENGCVEWRGTLKSTGYGVFSVNRMTYYAHRVALRIKLAKQLPCIRILALI